MRRSTRVTPSGHVVPDRDWSHVPFWKSQRVLTAAILFWGFANLYMNRVNLSIGMVCMVRDVPTEQDLNETHEDAVKHRNLKPGDPDYCHYLGLETNSDEEGDFEWSKQLQGLLLGSFFWGYLFLQIPGGVLSERYGPRRVIFFTMFPVGLLGLLSPVSAKVSPWLFLVVRVLLGLGEGALYSSTHALWARWSPPSERSSLVGMSFSGGQFGNAMIFPLGGILCSTLGWESIFYIMGGFCTVWCLVFWVFVGDSPCHCNRISDLERDYIMCHVSFKDDSNTSVPWKKILTCVPFWAILVAHTCGNYGLYMLLTQIPTYMKEVLKFDLKSNGLYSMLPYFTMWVFIALSSISSDAVIDREILSRTTTRKITSCSGLFLPALCLVLISYLDCTQPWSAVALLCGTVGLSGIAFSGYMVNHGDVAPLFAGTMFGVTNLAATVPGIIAPYVVGALTPNKTREEWQVAFFIAAVIYVLGGVFYLIFGSAQEQEWAVPREGQLIAPGKSMAELTSRM